jgi:hypothetical protein
VELFANESPVQWDISAIVQWSAVNLFFKTNMPADYFGHTQLLRFTPALYVNTPLPANEQLMQ